MKRNIKKTIGMVLFVLVNIGVIAVTAFFEFSKNAHKPASIPFLGLNFRFLFAAFGCLLFMLLAEMCEHLYMMKNALGKASFKTAFQVVVIGKYYDYITPMSAGGQPFQMHFLSRQGFPTGASVSMPITQFLSSQGAFLFIALAVFIFGDRSVVPPAVFFAAILGVLLHIAIPMAVVFFTVAPNFAQKLLKVFVRVLYKLHIVKDEKRFCSRLLSAVDEYRQTIKSMLCKPELMLRLFILAVIARASLYSLPFFVLRTFGGAATYAASFCICVYIYAAISFIPTPGNAGAAEGSFYALFSVLTASHLFWAMLVWRFFSYYAYILIGGSTLAFNALSGRKNRA